MREIARRGRMGTELRAGFTGTQQGLTLIELMITLVVAGVILTVAIPAFDRILVRNQSVTVANRLLGAMQTARQTAISRNTSVTFCAGNPQAGCHGSWDVREWIVFADVDRDGQLDAGEPIRIHDRFERIRALQLIGNGPFLSAIVFKASGAAQTPAGAFAAGRLRICTDKDIEPNSIDLVLIGSGRVESERRHLPGQCVGES